MWKWISEPHRSGSRELLLGTPVVSTERLVIFLTMVVVNGGWYQCPAFFYSPFLFWSICIMINPGRPFVNENGETMINACDHVFDCIEMGQGYHFHKGQVWHQVVFIGKDTYIKTYNLRSPSRADSMTLTTWLCGNIMAKIWITHQFGKWECKSKNVLKSWMQVGNRVCDSKSDG